jgi:hypothetical protein
VRDGRLGLRVLRFGAQGLGFRVVALVRHLATKKTKNK